MQVHTVNSNSRNSNCQCSPFSNKNAFFSRIFCISGWLAVPINQDKWSPTVFKSYLTENVRLWNCTKQKIFKEIIFLLWEQKKHKYSVYSKSRHFEHFNDQLNPICLLLPLLGAHHILHVSGIRVKVKTGGIYVTIFLHKVNSAVK